MEQFLNRFPVATALLVLVALVGGVDLVLDGDLSDDFALYSGIVLGGNAGVAIGRGLKS